MHVITVLVICSGNLKLNKDTVVFMFWFELNNNVLEDRMIILIVDLVFQIQFDDQLFIHWTNIAA